ncbi:MAG: AI-2E family transporter, partial [Caldilineaceae bacterium]|nr:AI-2E family transporter [Caldilineaceae bacterium]
MSQLARSTVLVLLTLIGLALVWLFREPILLFLLAVALSASLRPLIDRLRQRVSPAISIAMVYLALGLGIVALLLLAIGPLDGDVQNLANHLATTYERVAAQWPDSGQEFVRTVGNLLPDPDLLYKALSGQTEAPVVQGIASLVTGVGSLLGKGITILILSLYWSVDHVRFERLWLTTLPLATRGRVRRTWRDLEEGVGALVRSTFAQVVLSGVILWIGYALLGVPYAALLAVLGGIVQLVPWLSVLLAPLLVLLFGLINDPTAALLGAAYALVVSLVFEFRIQPRYFPRMRTSPLLLLIVALVFGIEFGLAGLIFAPAVTVAIVVLWVHLVEPARDGQPTIPTSLAELQTGRGQLQEILDRAPGTPEVVNLV